MPSTRDLLQRFRPAPTPGAATATGVPADRRDERAVELAGVFAALAATTEDAERIRREAVAEAEARRERAGQESIARVAQARLDAESLRAEEVARARDEVGASAAESRMAAEQRGRRIEREADRTRTEDVAAVVAAVRALVVAERPEVVR